MNRRISWAFLAVSVAFFLFIVGLTGYRLEDTRTRNSLQARDRLIELAARVGAIRSTYVSLDSLSARKELRALFDAQPRLLLLSVHSPSQGILYLVARNQSYLKDPAVPSPQWRGTPTYQVESGYEVALSRPLAATADSSGAMMDAVFVIMGREDLYPIVRDDLYLFLAFLLVSGVVILIVMSVQDVPVGNQGMPGSTSAAPASPSGAASPRSGLIRGEHFEPKLRWELEKAIAEGQDMSLARIRIDDPHADSQLPAVYTEVARILLIRFPAHDCLFETAGDALTAIIPETDIDVAVRNLEAFRKAVGGRPIEGRPRSLSIGVASRGGRLISASTLLEEADISLEKACREGGNQVIGFRADPSRYPGSLSAVR
jgi:GGDEF domain-containing protein